jgi:hypothetical protein
MLVVKDMFKTWNVDIMNIYLFVMMFNEMKGMALFSAVGSVNSIRLSFFVFWRK